MDTLKDSVIGPAVKRDFLEDYMIFMWRSSGTVLRLHRGGVSERYDPSRLLLYESGVKRFHEKRNAQAQLQLLP
jgi:hypothetical protein